MTKRSDKSLSIVISHAYSSYNNGDAAILSAQISELRRVFHAPQLRILSIDQIAKGYHFDHVPVRNALMFGAVKPGRSKLMKLCYSFGMVGYTAVWAGVYHFSRRRLPLPASWREPLDLLVNADMQVCIGGGYLRAKDDLSSTVILLLLFHQVWLAKALHKPVYLYAQSFGPYPRSLQQRIARFGLKRADLILVRESKSLAALEDIGISGDTVLQVPDSAFAFAPEHSTRIDAFLPKKRSGTYYVGITVRSWLETSGQQAYEAAMAACIDRLQQLSNIEVIVIPQVTSTLQHDDDRAVGKRLARLLTRSDRVVFIDRRLSHYDIKAVYGCLDYLIGTRFHSVIFALTAYVPAIAIEYEHKTSGIMNDLGLGQWVLPIEAVTADRLWTLFERLQRERTQYTAHLQQVMPGYIDQAQHSAELIRQSYLTGLGDSNANRDREK